MLLFPIFEHDLKGIEHDMRWCYRKVLSDCVTQKSAYDFVLIRGHMTVVILEYDVLEYACSYKLVI